MKSDDLTVLYKNRFDEKDLPRKKAVWKVLCNEFLQRFVDPADTVVDVACGYGEFINNIAAGRKIAVDLNLEARDLLDPGVEFHQRSATELAAVVPGIADVVMTSNFLEHLPNKQVLEEFLDQVLAALKPGGRYLILGPNLRYLPGQYWDFYDHHLGLTDRSLCEVLKLRGFEVERCIDRFLPYTTQGALPTHPLLVSIYLKVPLAWRLLGKQFFIVAAKPSAS